MPRNPIAKLSPWALALDLATVARDHWYMLEEKDRARLSAIVRKSKGNPGNLTKRERDDLKRLVGKLDFLSMGKDMIPVVGQLRRQRRRRR